MYKRGAAPALNYKRSSEPPRPKVQFMHINERHASCASAEPTPPESRSRSGSIRVMRSSDQPRTFNPRRSGKSMWQKCVEEDIVLTPFSKTLASLRNVRQNYITLAKVFFPSAGGEGSAKAGDWTAGLPKRRSRASSSDLPSDPYAALAVETLADLDWCLEMLEAIRDNETTAADQSSKKSPVYQMSKDVFYQLLRRELSKMTTENGPGDENIANFLSSTYLGHVHTPRPTSAKPGRVRKITASAMGVVPEHGVQTPYVKELGEYLEDLDSWGVDIFQISEYSNNSPLTCVCYTILKKRGLLEVFQLPPMRIVTYLEHLEDCYRDTPYHNSIHAADVVQSTHALLSAKSLHNVFTDLEIFATLFAAAIHDVDHPGLTNQYLINTSSDLALMYSDLSVLENHHLAVGFSLLQKYNSDIFFNLTKLQRHSLRKMVISIVLATDMSKFMRMLGDLKTTANAKRVTGAGVLKLYSDAERLQVLENAVHCADLSNPTKPLEIYRCWVDRIMAEFFRQGDLEREQGMEVSPMCDREAAVVEKSQVGFIKFIAQPLWETWAELVSPCADHVLDTLDDNREWYQSMIAEPSPESAGDKSGNAFVPSPSQFHLDEDTENRSDEQQTSLHQQPGQGQTRRDHQDLAK